MSTTLVTPQLTGTCPTCGGNFETCRCTGLTPLAPQAGWLEDMEDNDNQRGPERDETDTSFRELVDRLVDDGDARAQAAGRRARRTLAEMAPGYTRQPILHLTRPPAFRSEDDRCPLCECWRCRCGSGVAPVPTDHPCAARNPEYACGICGGWHAGSCPSGAVPAPTAVVTAKGTEASR
ncbi:hypothetical protein OG909_32750 (plasmid) [Streptomyces sp. NBC_01754]|uniref:hypothetical protein n=1 Tax=Streptomyces sp. NBC_01754 TaxID=2975930 RepID=UPI002DDB8EC8|nr:hypothetical protein [Streptomyces sp. NBC_01754]WSC97076.1 hypothetical protein OG909_32750 [Streptomyces sp. NBC_01754]